MGTYTWTGYGNSTSVTDAANWVDEEGKPGLPRPNDAADSPIDATILSGVLDVASLSIEGQVNYQGGSFAVAGNVVVNTASGDLSLLSGVTGTVGGDLIVGEAESSAGRPRRTIAR